MRRIYFGMILILIGLSATGDYVRTPVAKEVLFSMRADGKHSFEPIFERYGVRSDERSSLLVNLIENDPLCSTNGDKFCYHQILGAITAFGTTNAVDLLTSVFNGSDEMTDKLISMRGLARLTGISSNLLDNVSSWMSTTNKDERYRRLNAYIHLSEIVAEPSHTSAEKALVLSFLNEHVGAETVFVMELDAAIQRLDPTYAESKRRLRNLRAVQQQIRYKPLKLQIGNAIDALVAYPEISLPE